MTSSNEPLFKAEGFPQSSTPALDYRRVLFRAINKWYIIVISVIVGAVLAFLVNRYTTRIYPISASIIIRESEENSDAQFIYNNALINQYRNYYNELYIIESYPIIQGVVEDLNFHVSIQKEGNIKSTEQYNLLPLTLEVLTPPESIVPGSLSIEVKDQNSYLCIVPGADEESRTTYRFGDTTECNGNRVILRRNGDVSRYIGERYRILIRKPEDVATAMIGRLSLSWAQVGSSVVNFYIEDAIPTKGVDFLNSLILHYQKYDLDKKIQASSRSIEFIEDQLRIIRDSLSRHERELQTFKYQNILTELSEETSKLYEQLKELDAQKVGLMISANYYIYLDKYIKDENSSLDKVVLPSSIGVIDPVLDGLVQQLLETQSTIRLMGNKEDTKNPLIVAEKNRLIESKQRILEAINNLRATDQIKSEFIDRQIRKVEDELAQIPGAERLLANIKRKYSFDEEMYKFLTQKLAEAGISKASTTSDIVMVNPPRVSGAPITPKVLTNYAVFLGVGLLLPLLVFVLLEYLNDKVQSRDEIERYSSIPFIGGIGHKEDPSNLIVINKPKSSIAESFRALRSNLNFFVTGRQKVVLMVTSSISGEGKTFTTINLATVIAMTGKKTIIIGADLRKPKIFSDFKLANEKGLSTYLSGMAGLEEIIQETGTENLWLITGGPAPPNPSELILNERMDALMHELKARYDFIILDTPPIALIADALVLNKYADHTIYIVRQNYTPVDMVRSANELYITGKMSNMSMVLNDIIRSGPGYGYGYGYNYGYYNYGYYGPKKKRNGEGYYQD